ncbi:MAG TPA: hypothetical protein VGN17_26065 [Bryobacteraceae bacterium]|jgi:hypothetical protein
MAFTTSLDNTCLSIWGVSALWVPQDYSGPQSITGIISPPPLEEQVIPGSTHGTSIVYFWVRFVEIQPSPMIGDTITLDGILYNLDKVNVDSMGSAMLHLRRAS